MAKDEQIGILLEQLREANGRLALPAPGQQTALVALLGTGLGEHNARPDVFPKGPRIL